MRTYTLTHVSDAVLLRELVSLVSRERAATAAVLAHIAEVEARRLYLPAGYESMHAYCVGELHYSEDAAYKRIRVARAALRNPALFEAVAECRLHLAGIYLLAPHLNSENADELIAAATHKSKSEIERLVARRFPQTESMALVQPLPTPHDQLAPGPVVSSSVASDVTVPAQLAPGPVEPPRSRVKPVACERFALQCMIGKETHDKLDHARALLSHALPSGDIAQVLDRALDALIRQLEKRKYGATRTPRRPSRRPSANPRHIPADVRRAVRERDQDQCTFVSETGHRCNSRKSLEFDHIDPVARGGQATVENLRLRCRAHNQYEAERAFGAGFMIKKREEARRKAAEAREHATEARKRKQTLAQEHARDMTAGLRTLGFRTQETRRALEFCESLDVATLEERMKAALRFLRPSRTSGNDGTSARATT